jgi:hypothetical protein
MNNTLLQTIEPEWVEFIAHKISSAEVVWVDQECHSDSDLPTIKQLQQKMIDENAYAIKEASCFADLHFDLSDSKTLIAERYGGGEIGTNGGGGRCGNNAQYQLKGVGPNCMVGDHHDVMHKYGGLDAPLAIIETIYTNLFSKLLPLGAVKIHGLIYTGAKTAIYHHSANKCWGIIMVREKCIRPAHFMRAAHFKPQAEYKDKLVGDVARVRSINKRLSTHFKDNNQFILFLGKFLQDCANQFSFARATRVMHGTLSPSNISIDGRWLDLPITSMLSGGVNYSLTSQFYSEHQAPLTYAIELLHSYSKYNKLQLNPAPLIHYYNEQFHAYFRHHIEFVLGLNKNKNGEPFDAVHWKPITDVFYRVIHSGKYAVTRPPTPSDTDPVCALIVALFLSIKKSKIAECYFRTAQVFSEEAEQLSEHFSALMSQDFSLDDSNDGTIGSSREHHYTTCLLSALKRAYLAEIFYSTEVEKNVTAVCNEKSPSDIAPLIDSYKKIADWAFFNILNEIYLFQSHSTAIYYSPKNGQYYLKEMNGEVSHFSSFTSLHFRVSAMDSALFTINNVEFMKFFGKLNYFMSIVEKIDCATEADHDQR